MVGQRGSGAAFGQLQQQFLDKVEQVVDLLELAPRVLVELALTREDVQLFEQFDGLPRFDLIGQRRWLGRWLLADLEGLWLGHGRHGWR